MEKKYFVSLMVSILILSVGLCVAKPKIHKPFSINIIEYVIKFKTNGQIDTIKTTTSTTLEEKVN